MTKTHADPIKDNGPDAIALSEAEKNKALAEGARDAVKESGHDAYQALTDGSLPGEPPKRQYHGSDEIMQFAGLIDLGVEEFEARIASKGDDAIPEEKVYGLLALERNGQNRTPYVKAMMTRLHLKKEDLPGGGPDYTNDVTPVTKL